MFETQFKIFYRDIFFFFFLIRKELKNIFGICFRLYKYTYFYGEDRKKKKKCKTFTSKQEDKLFAKFFFVQ